MNLCSHYNLGPPIQESQNFFNFIGYQFSVNRMQHSMQPPTVQASGRENNAVK